MSHGCHKCNCPNGCRCDELAEARKLRDQIGKEAFDALVKCGEARAEHRSAIKALDEATAKLAFAAAHVRSLLTDAQLHELKAKFPL